MEQLKAKQVDGVIDNASPQDIKAEKSFFAPQHFISTKASLTVDNGILYWCKTPGVLEEEENVRLFGRNGKITVQSFTGGQWS